MGMAAGIMGAGAVVSALGARQQAQAQQASLNYQSQVAQNNAQISQDQAAVAMQSGTTNIQGQDIRAANLIGAQRAQLGASGVDLGSGSANDLITSTRFMANRDHATAVDNAMRQAWGYQVQSADQASNAAALGAMSSSISPNFNAFTSLLGSATGAARMFYGSSLASGSSGANSSAPSGG